MGPSTFLLAAATAFTAFTSVSANPVADPVANPVANPVAAFTPQATADEVLVGCYSSLLSFSAGDSYKWQTSGHCKEQCIPKNKAVIAINGTDCWCSDTLPPKASKVDSSNCDTICPGFGTVKCGSGMDYFSVWNDGLKTSLDNADGSNSVSPVSSSAAGSTPTSPSVVTVIGGQTIVVTASSSADAGNTQSSSGPNKAGIAAGVVVGVVVIAALCGGGYLYLRAKKRRELEEEHKRQAAINSFVSGKPGSSAGQSSFDTRLEPAIMRRMSDGSIADNQDYSRRILKVTNA